MITITEENDVEDKTRSKKTDSDEVSSKYSRFDGILIWIVTKSNRENIMKWRFGWNVTTRK